MEPLSSFFAVSVILLGIGIYGLTTKRNAIRILFTVMLVGPKMGETPLGLKRVSLLAAILVSLLLGMTGALANATAFPGPDSCGSGCSLTLLSTSLLKSYGVQLEFMSLVMAAAVIGALALSKTDRGQ